MLIFERLASFHSHTSTLYSVRWIYFIFFKDENIYILLSLFFLHVLLQRYNGRFQVVQYNHAGQLCVPAMLPAAQTGHVLQRPRSGHDSRTDRYVLDRAVSLRHIAVSVTRDRTLLCSISSAPLVTVTPSKQTDGAEDEAAPEVSAAENSFKFAVQISASCYDDYEYLLYTITPEQLLVYFVGDVCRRQTRWGVTEVHPPCTVSAPV